MTVESTKNKSGPFNATGGSGTFPRDFLVLDEDHLRVIRVRDGIETDLAAGVGHTGIGEASGTVVVNSGLQAGDQVYLLRAVPNLQRSDYNAQGRVRTDQVESDFDLHTMQIQDLSERQSRALTLGVSAELSGEEALEAAIRAPEYAADALEAAERAEAAAAEASSGARSYATRAEFVAALPGLDQGLTVLVEGQPYVVDSTATGSASALSDLGVDGVRRPIEVRNLYLSAFFTSQGDNTVHLCTSLDGVHFQTLNAATLPVPGGGGLSVRDTSITWHEGEWWIFATGAAQGSHDFVIFRSRDLVTWSKHQVSMGGGPYFSDTVPFPGGTSPCDSIWAPEPFVEDGRLYVAIAVRYGADLTDVYGGTINNRSMVLVELLDSATMAFSVPQMLDMSGATTSLIDMSIVKSGAIYWGAVKDDAAKNIQIRSSPSLTGPWALENTIGDAQLSIEAPCLTPFYAKGLNSMAETAGWRLYVDNNRTGPSAPDPGTLVGRPYFMEVTDLPSAAWSAMKSAYFDVPVRHGSVVNLASLPPEAMQSLMQAVTGRAAPRRAMIRQTQIGAGTQVIHPQPGHLYYVSAADAADVILRDGPADQFFLGVMSAQRAAGMSVRAEGFSNRSFILGHGRGNDAVIEMRRRSSDGAFYPVGTVRRAEFKAVRTTAQTISAAADVAIDWTSEVFDFGSTFDPATDRWTPPRGAIEIDAQVSIHGTESFGSFEIHVAKNGVNVASTFTVTNGGLASARVSLKGDEASGSDYYQIIVRASGSGSRTVNQNNNLTYFHGISW